MKKRSGIELIRSKPEVRRLTNRVKKLQLGESEEEYDVFVFEGEECKRILRCLSRDDLKRLKSELRSPETVGAVIERTNTRIQ